MKLSTLFVGASVTLNVVLLVALAGGAFSRGEATAPALTKPEATVTATSAAARAAAIAADAADTPEAWAGIEAGDLPTQVARLRAEGFPPATIRAIMAAQVRAQFAARRKAVDAATAATPFWESSVDPKVQAEQRALAREEQKALRDLLGPDEENSTAARLKRSYPDFPPEKVDQIAQIRDRYDEKRSEIYSANSGSFSQVSEDRATALDKAMHAEFAAVLSPQELEAWDLRESRTASRLRYSLSVFDPTEQEYKALFKLQSAFDEQFGSGGPGMLPAAMDARMNGQKLLTEQIKTALGEERFAEYQRATDYNYQRTTQLVARLNLPPATANELYVIQQSAQQQANDLRRRPPTTADRAAALAQMSAFVTDIEAQIAAKLGGPSGLEAYKLNAGNWLNNLNNTLRPPTPPPPRK